jgi:hypothetical protein
MGDFSNYNLCINRPLLLGLEANKQVINRSNHLLHSLFRQKFLVFIAQFNFLQKKCIQDLQYFKTLL